MWWGGGRWRNPSRGNAEVVGTGEEMGEFL